MILDFLDIVNNIEFSLLDLLRSVTMAQCVRAFVKKEAYGDPAKAPQASFG